MKQSYHFLFIFFLVCFTSKLYSQSVLSYVPTNGLVGWSGFNGNAQDGSGNHSTNNGATLTTDRFENLNSTFFFHPSTAINFGNSVGDFGNANHNGKIDDIRIWERTTAVAPPRSLVITTIGQVNGCIGDTISVPVSLQNTGDIAALGLTINYNAANLTFVGAANVNSALGYSRLRGGRFLIKSANFNGQQQVLATWYDLDPVVLNGLLFNMRFVVTASSNLEFDLTIVESDGETWRKCEYADGNDDIIPKTKFVNGGVNALNQPSETTITENLPFGGSLTICGQTLNSSGTYKVVCSGAAVNGCDSIINVNLNVAPAIITNIANISGCVGDTVSVPVIVNNLNNIGVISLALNYNASALTFIGFENAQLAIQSSNLLVNAGVFAGQSQVRLSWFNTNPISLGNSPVTLVNYRFVVNASSILAWDLATPGNCEYADASAKPITGVLFNNGAVTVNSVPVTNLTKIFFYGTTFAFCGQTLNYSGNYSCTLTSSAGCDSIVNLALTQVDGIKIGNQIWQSKNLDVKTFNNGDVIPEAKTVAEWKKAGENSEPAWCYYENNPENGKKYGRLYNHHAVMDSRGLCPTGWHVPSHEEWENLNSYFSQQW